MSEVAFPLSENSTVDGERDGKWVVFEKGEETYFKSFVRVVRYNKGEYVSSVTMNHVEAYRLFRRLQSYVRGRLDWEDDDDD
jgi:hypothetical protein